MRLKCVWLKGLSVDSQYILAYMQEAPTFHIWHPIGEWCHKFLEPEFSLHVSPRWVQDIPCCEWILQVIPLFFVPVCPADDTYL